MKAGFRRTCTNGNLASSTNIHRVVQRAAANKDGGKDQKGKQRASRHDSDSDGDGRERRGQDSNRNSRSSGAPSKKKNTPRGENNRAGGRSVSSAFKPQEAAGLPGVRELLIQQLAAARQDLAQRTQFALEQMEHACMDSLQHMETMNAQLRRENERLNGENERLHGVYSSGGGHMGGTGESPALRNGGTGATGNQELNSPAGSKSPNKANTALSVMPPVSKRPPTPSCEEGPPTMTVPGTIMDSDAENSLSDIDVLSGDHGSDDADEKVRFMGVADEDDDEEPSDGSGVKRRKHRSMFADADKMKAKVREAVMKKEYDVRNAYKDTGIFAWIAKSTWFDHLTLGVILVNALWIAIDLDWNTEKYILNAHPLFQAMEFSFCGYFSIEVLIRFIAFRNKLDCLRDSWFMFDSGLVLMMMFDTGVMTLVIWMNDRGSGGNESSSGFADPTILRLFRLLKLTRMARMIRLLRATPELMILIKGIMVAFRSVIFTLFLLLIFIYLFAILFKSLLEDSDLGADVFPSVPHAMLSLLLKGTLPDNEDFVMSIWNENYLYGLLAIFFILMTSLTVMNMLVGVLVEVVGVVSSVEKEQMNVQFVYSKLQELLTTSGLDADGDMRISKAEFESLLLNPKAARMVQEVGVDVVGLVDFSEYLFQNDATLSFPEFMDLVLQLRGSNTATVKDVVDLRKFIASQVMEMTDMLKASYYSAQNLREKSGMPRTASPNREIGARLDVAHKLEAIKSAGQGAAPGSGGQWAAPRPPSAPGLSVPNPFSNFDHPWNNVGDKSRTQLLDEEV